jgi:hypothetical protein
MKKEKKMLAELLSILFIGGFTIAIVIWMALTDKRTLTDVEREYLEQNRDRIQRMRAKIKKIQGKDNDFRRW